MGFRLEAWNRKNNWSNLRKSRLRWLNGLSTCSAYMRPEFDSQHFILSHQYYWGPLGAPKWELIIGEKAVCYKSVLPSLLYKSKIYFAFFRGHPYQCGGGCLQEPLQAWQFSVHSEGHEVAEIKLMAMYLLDSLYSSWLISLAHFEILNINIWSFIKTVLIKFVQK